MSLCGKNGVRTPAQLRMFVEWVGIVGAHPDVVDALNLLATETVAAVVDAACVLRVETMPTAACSLSVSDLLSNVVNTGIGMNQLADAAVVASSALRPEHYREAIRRFPRVAQGHVIL